MPNRRNVERPITLVGLGRSGTTLVYSIFDKHPKVQALGETGNLVYSSYLHILESLPHCGERKRGESLEEAAARSVHAVLNRTFPSRSKHWFQKPIRIPTVARHYMKDFPSFVDFYWRASEVLFPGGRFLTVLRNPHDVVVSSMTRWKMEPGDCIRMLRWNYDLMLSPASRVALYLDFDELSLKKEESVRKLLEFSGVGFHKRCLNAYSWKHAENPQRTSDLPEIEIPDDVLARYELLRLRIGDSYSPQSVLPAPEILQVKSDT